MVLARVVSKMASSMRNGPFFCIQTFWRRFMVTNEAANSFPAEKNWRKKTKDRKKMTQVTEDSIDLSRVSNIESDNSQNVGLEDYNNISDGIFPHFTTPSIKITLG